MMSAIARLPESTTRLLGSPLVVTTPVALVKELLDNAIDAHATSVEVLISQNTISKIEVRDDGVGIHPDDYDSLGRRGHTSKLRTFEELRAHGSKTLGFRGEALAAVNALAKVTVITRTSEDPVGATLHLVSGIGGVAQQQITPIPIGTTVRINELFGCLPVREQVAIKEAPKTLDNIRVLLKTYAMARPAIRLALKVFQAPRQNWTYSPKRGASVKEAVLQIAGNEVAAHCLEKIFRTNRPTSGDDVSSNPHPISGTDSYTFEAYIIDPEADLSKFPKQSYFSVDGRPVSAKRGTTKKILDIYTGAIEIKPGNSPSSVRSSGYFIRLNIVCPRGSYDVNVEPSKDDVLFTDEKLLLDKFVCLCKEVYKLAKVDRSINTNPRLEPHDRVDIEDYPTFLSSSITSAKEQEAFAPIPLDQVNNRTLLESAAGLHQEAHPTHTPHDRHPLPQKRPHSDAVLTTAFKPINKQAIDPKFGVTSSKTTKDLSPANTALSQWKVDMSTDINERTEEDHRKKRARPTQTIPETAGDPGEAGVAPMQDLNPWIIAKMNAPVHTRRTDTVDSQDQMSNGPLEMPLTPELPILRHPRGPLRDLEVPPNQRLHLPINNHHDSDSVPGGPYRSPVSSPMGTTSQEGFMKALARPNLALQRRRPQPPWTPPSSIQRPSAARPSAEGGQRVGLERGRNFNGLGQTKLSSNKGIVVVGNRMQQHEVQTNALPFPNPTSPNINIHDDFEAIFSSARRKLDEQLPQQSVSQINNQHHEPRKPFCQLRSTNIQSNTQSATQEKEPIKTTFPTGDPRAYLLRRQKSIGTGATSGPRSNVRRQKSGLMPFENTPPGDQTQLLTLILDCDIQQLHHFVKQLQPYDKYMAEGELEDGIDMSLDEGHRVELRLKALLQKKVEDANDQGGDIELNLGSLLKRKGPAIDI